MADFKKQHIIPRSYLARFADVNGNVYRIDAKRAISVHHKPQNQKDNFYTSQNRKNFENELSLIENLFSKLVIQTDYAADKECFSTSLQHRSLVFSMLHLYARVNPKRDNYLKIKGTPINGYTRDESTLIINIFAAQKAAMQLLLNPKDDLIDVGIDFKALEEELYYSTLKLSVAKIKSSNRNLITSDNPMSFFCDAESNEIFGYLPLSPKEGLLIFNRQKFKPVQSITKSGANLLNSIQILNSQQCIFTSPNDIRRDSYEYKAIRLKHESFASKKEKLFDVRLSVSKDLNFIVSKNEAQLDMPSYEIACNKLGNDILVNSIDKTIHIKSDMNLDEAYCFCRLAEIRDHLAKNPPPHQDSNLHTVELGVG